MAFFKKTKHEPALTSSDRERIARANESDLHKNRKVKAKLYLKKSICNQEFVFFLYAPDEANIKEQIASKLKWFQEAEPNAGWKIIKTDWLSRDVNEIAEEGEK